MGAAIFIRGDANSLKHASWLRRRSFARVEVAVVVRLFVASPSLEATGTIERSRSRMQRTMQVTGDVDELALRRAFGVVCADADRAAKWTDAASKRSARSRCRQACAFSSLSGRIRYAQRSG